MTATGDDDDCNDSVIQFCACLETMKARFWISRMPIVIGTTIFGAGIYMGYVELINMDTDTNLTRQELGAFLH